MSESKIDKKQKSRECHVSNRREGYEFPLFGSFFYFLYGILHRASFRRFMRYLVLRLEKGPLYSVTIRRIFLDYHDIEIGMYTGRGCFEHGNFPAGTRIGRYTAIYRTVLSFNANHPMNLKSTHALFYNPGLGVAKEDLLTRSQLTIGNDVWIGHNAILLAGVTRIGDGAIIGAGSVVHQDVPPYAVVVGNPARVVRYRFKEETIQALLAERWWNRSFEELRKDLSSFQVPLEGQEQIR